MRATFIFLPAAAAAGALFVMSTPASGGGGGGNTPPVCTFGGVVTVECNGQGLSVHQLDAGASDADGDPLTYSWSFGQSCATQGSFDDPTLAMPTLTFDMLGACVDECGGIQVSVSDGVNPPVVCSGALIIQDTLAPTISCPADIGTQLWQGGPNGGPNDPSVDPSVTGMATGSDDCSPAAPVMTEVVTLFPDPHFPQGLEAEIVRTWDIVGCTGAAASCSQTITLVGPSFFSSQSATMDVDLGFNPSYLPVPNSVNGYVATTTEPIEVLVHGSDDFSVFQLVARKLELTRWDGEGQPVSPVKVLVGDFGTPDVDGFDHTTTTDGYTDMLFQFDAGQVANAFDLFVEPDGKALQLHLSGMQWDGQPFVAKDVVLVQQ